MENPRMNSPLSTGPFMSYVYGSFNILCRDFHKTYIICIQYEGHLLYLQVVLFTTKHEHGQTVIQ